METNQIIADNIKRIRTEKHLSLGQLAELSGVSKVILSQIEKGNANPTINTVWKIASGLKVPGTQLFDTSRMENTVVRLEEAQKQAVKEEGYASYTYYKANAERTFDWFIVELEPGKTHETSGHNHSSTEYVYVMNGVMNLKLETGAYELREGHSIHFPGEQTHVFGNDTDEILRFVSVVYYR